MFFGKRKMEESVKWMGAFWTSIAGVCARVCAAGVLVAECTKSTPILTGPSDFCHVKAGTVLIV